MNGCFSASSQRKFDPVQRYDNILLFDSECTEKSKKKMVRHISKNPRYILFAKDLGLYQDIDNVHPLITEVHDDFSILEGQESFAFIAGKRNKMNILLTNKVRTAVQSLRPIETYAINLPIVPTFNLETLYFCSYIADSLWYTLPRMDKVVVHDTTDQLRLYPASQSPIFEKYGVDYDKNGILIASMMEYYSYLGDTIDRYYFLAGNVGLAVLDKVESLISERRK